VVRSGRLASHDLRTPSVPAQHIEVDDVAQLGWKTEERRDDLLSANALSVSASSNNGCKEAYLELDLIEPADSTIEGLRCSAVKLDMAIVG
jgi:hypothetical protein